MGTVIDGSKEINQMALKIRKQCPQCKGELFRIQRRPADRLLSIFIGMKRYQCQNDSCGWSGNIQTSTV